MKQFYTTRQASEKLRGMTILNTNSPWPYDIARWCREGRIETIKLLNGRYSISEDELQRIIDTGKLRDTKIDTLHLLSLAPGHYSRG